MVVGEVDDFAEPDDSGVLSVGEVDDFDESEPDSPGQEDFSRDTSGIEQPASQDQQEPPGESLGAAKDVGIQAARGAASAYTWPLDLLKSLFVGAHHPMSEDEILDLERRTGIPVDREELKKSQEQFMETGKRLGEYIPTQEAAEKLIEKKAGISLEPQTRIGKFVRQGAELAALSRGKGLKSALARGAAGASATMGLEESEALSPEVSKLAGDVLSMMPSRRPKGFTASETALKDVAEKHKMPFPELMTRVKAPFIRAEVSEATKDTLKQEFNTSMSGAVEDIISGKLPIRKLRSRGVNLDELQKHAHEQVNRSAANVKGKLSTGSMVHAIEARKLSLNPSLADKTRVTPSSHANQRAIDILNEHKRQLSPRRLDPLNPEAKIPPPKQMTASELVQRYRDNNENVRELYRKAYETPVDKEVERTYAFLNDILMDKIERVGGPELAQKLKAANKITRQVKQSEQVESFLAGAMHEGDFVPGKLEKKLGTPRADKIKKLLGEPAIREIAEVAKYRSLAEKNLEKFLNLPGQAFRKEVSDWGVLAPLLFFSPHAGVATYAARKSVARLQGRLLTRPATRRIYRRITRLAAAGEYDLLREDFDKLNAAISREFGSPEAFIEDSMSFEGGEG